MTGYWDERHELTPEPTTEMDVDDQNGGRHLVFLARVDDESVRDALRPTLDALAEFDCLAVVPQSYLHVTVTVAGNVGPDQRLSAGDEADIAAAGREAFADAPAFEVTFPRLDLFPSVVFAAVDDGGSLRGLNERACGIEGIEVHDRDEGYVPHLTLAQFRSQKGYEDLLAWLEGNRTLDVPSVRVTDVELVAVDLDERFPDFETVARYPLAD
ncbi:2'-5' RNA ligase family protein [Halobacterium wangiae]|uniref:2'-5' RNA ligase family protein n=1 Tax=Halobacterium wangiae TaxID=2902623 RepID=UPI001E4365B5|nr:2'-5' RNA ligase family protein [Halobacterium wangiae]